MDIQKLKGLLIEWKQEVKHIEQKKTRRNLSESEIMLVTSAITYCASRLEILIHMEEEGK